MLVPELRYTLAERSQMPYQIAIVGIETHICVTQTALDLLSELCFPSHSFLIYIAF